MIGQSASLIVSWNADSTRGKADRLVRPEFTPDGQGVLGHPVTTLIRSLAVSDVEPYATYLDADPDELVQPFQSEQINRVVAGGETEGAFKMITGSYRGHTVVCG